MSVNPKVVTVGQEVEEKCWSDRSHPAASLQFYLNGNRVKEDSMGVMEIFRESDGILQSSFRKMRLVVRESHSEAGVVNVKCNANIGEAYWQTSQLNINVVNKPSFKLQSRSHSNSGKNINFMIFFKETSVLYCCREGFVFMTFIFQILEIHIWPPLLFYQVKYYFVNKSPHSAHYEGRFHQIYFIRSNYFLGTTAMQCRLLSFINF